MLTVTVDFLHGMVRAAPYEDVALTGQASEPEWPPSPARLYAAFVAADGTGARCRVTGGSAGLHHLEAAPVVLADAPDDVVTSTIEARYVVIDERAKNTSQEYPARENRQVRPGARASLRHGRVVYHWPDAEVDAQDLHALRLRAARVGYLGCADSPVRVRVSTDLPTADGLASWLPDPEGDDAISVAYPGLLEQLDQQFDAWTGGVPQRRAWLAPRLARYRSPASLRRVDSAASTPAGSTVWLRFDRALDPRKVIVVAETLRAATLERAAALFGGRRAVPEVLHGHHAVGTTGVEHARWLPLPHAGFPHADGRIRGAAVWLPPGTESDIVDTVLQAVSELRELTRPGQFSVGVRPFDGTSHPWATNPRRWLGPSRSWVTVFPAVHERFVRGQPTLEDLAQWCRFAGLPRPVWGRAARVPLAVGVPSLPPQATVRSGAPVRPFSHVELRFEEPVIGPVSIGRGRHFGLGLMAPVQGRLP